MIARKEPLLSLLVKQLDERRNYTCCDHPRRATRSFLKLSAKAAFARRSQAPQPTFTSLEKSGVCIKAIRFIDQSRGPL